MENTLTATVKIKSGTERDSLIAEIKEALEKNEPCGVAKMVAALWLRADRIEEKLAIRDCQNTSNLFAATKENPLERRTYRMSPMVKGLLLQILVSVVTAATITVILYSATAK